MGNRDERVDAYIAKANDFAVPILEHLRNLMHTINPEVKETIKWGFIAFDYKGPFCHMAAFRQHAVFGFWKAALMNDTEGFLQKNSADGGSAMGNFGRLTALWDLPPDDVIAGYIRQAMKINEDGLKLPARKKDKGVVVAPLYFLDYLRKEPLALENFNRLSPSHQREYIEWAEDAKTEKTRESRLSKTLELLKEGLTRNWKYQKAKT